MQAKGFTLIELLIVVSIIGILAGIVVISLGDSSETARKNKAKANVAQAVRTMFIKQAAEGKVDVACPQGTASIVDNIAQESVLYCRNIDTSGDFLVFEVYSRATPTNLSVWCADKNSPTPKDITSDISETEIDANDKYCTGTLNSLTR